MQLSRYKFEERPSLSLSVLYRHFSLALWVSLRTSTLCLVLFKNLSHSLPSLPGKYWHQYMAVFEIFQFCQETMLSCNCPEPHPRPRRTFVNFVRI